ASAIFVSSDTHDLAVTPDGTRIVYVGASGTQLFVRSLDALEPTTLATGRPRGVFVSHDGEWAGFFDDGSIARKKVALSGGAATTITRLPVGSPRGAAWMPDNTIVFATAGAATRRGLFKVSADGGEATPLTTPNRDRGEAWHSWPELLPDGHTLLFAIGRLEGRRDAANIPALRLPPRPYA